VLFLSGLALLSGAAVLYFRRGADTVSGAEGGALPRAVEVTPTVLEAADVRPGAEVPLTFYIRNTGGRAARVLGLVPC
jgi:hypothetical protein